MAASLFKWFFVGIFFLSPDRGGFGEDRHPLYITVTEINHNAKDHTLEISCKIFTNDFESVLEKAAHVKVDLSVASNASGRKATEKLIDDYITKHLQLKVDGKAVTLRFVGSEKETDATWSYFQVNDIPSLKRIDITNSLLYDGFDQEINIMHVSVGGERKSARLNYPNMEISFNF